MAIYRAYNKRLGSWASAAIPDVLDTKALTGVATNVNIGTENIITVSSTTGLFPGMGLAIPNIPRGAFIQSIKSATEIVAYAPLLDVATGEWTVTAAAAKATAAGVGMTGHAHGFNPVPIPEAITAGEVWRNTFSSSFKNGSADITIGSGATDFAPFTALTGGYVVNPDTALAFADVNGTKKLVVASTSSLKMIVSDEFAVKPYRAKTRWRHNHWLVSSTGNISTIPADVDIVVQLITSTPA